jgi:glutamate-1-semialdehyde 2,1-aminomutase
MESMNNTIAIIQARMNSTRLPGKVLLDLGNKKILDHVYERVRLSKFVNKIVIAITNNIEDDVLDQYCKDKKYEVFRGSENDVLGRYYHCAKKFKATRVVRITADCPLIDPDLIDELIVLHNKGDLDYVSNTIEPSYPDGLDAEVISFSALKGAFLEASSSHDREHVTPYIKKNTMIKKVNLKYTIDYSHLRWTIDEISDYNFLKSLFKLNISGYEDWSSILNLLNLNEEKLELSNQKIIRNEGSKINLGQKLYLRAKNVILGGNMLLSKRPEMFLPSLWPAYFDTAKGCMVTDLDGNNYIDMCIMGIGTNSLGYGNNVVDNAVSNTINKGNMSTLNCPEEVLLLEKLISMHPWASMGKLTRSGGEANAVALRIARSFVGKSKVAICGYHGWHDWYLSANISQSNGLDTHLLPGLSTKGVPNVLEGEVVPFYYNDISTLEALFKQHDDLGVIFMEVQRNHAPEKKFLHKVRQLADDYGAVLIFDECTSGFRETYGGLHLKYEVNPDIAMFGKALGNGYAINAIIGKDHIMQSAQDSFISSTFWTERIGPTAALATLKQMEDVQSWNIISSYGKQVKDIWNNLSKEFDLKIEIQGLDSLASFIFLSENSSIYKTFLTQEMLKKGYLASTIFYASTAHSNDIINDYGDALRPIFEHISNVESGFLDSNDLLDAEVCHQGFKRLN